MVSISQIEKFAQEIGHNFSPQQVVLFGSYAWGTTTIDSDVDLLVVMNHEGKGWKKATEIRQRIRPQFPLDLLVRTPQQIQERIILGDCFIKEICAKGRILYEAPHE